MNPPSIILIATVGELVLKGKNRRHFERKLLENLRLALRGQEVVVKPLFGRFLLHGRDGGGLTDPAAVRLVASRVFGIATLAEAVRVEKDLAKIERRINHLLRDRSFRDFAVRVNRADKEFPGTSVELERDLGGAVVRDLNRTVNLTNPELTISVDIQEEAAYIWTDRLPAAGGLPVGSSGKVLSLLSAGIDSPVASYRMLRRGARVFYLHFHSYPLTSQASIDNVRAIANHLQQSQPETTLLLAPLADLQKRIVTSAPPKLRVVLYRRAMFQIAERLARKYDCGALITGESLGQVASQTLQNMRVTGSGLDLPILRPLIGMDKQEIVDQARLLGTYELSIRPYEDCCSLLVPRGVETHAKRREVEAVEAALPWSELLSQVVDATTVEKIGEITK